MRLFGYYIIKEEDMTTTLIRTMMTYQKSFAPHTWTRERWRQVFLKHLRRVKNPEIDQKLDIFKED